MEGRATECGARLFYCYSTSILLKEIGEAKSDKNDFND